MGNGNVKQPLQPVPQQVPQRIIYALQPPPSHVIVCAIDFGTTYTGYAFSFLHEYKENKLQMYCQPWKGASGMTSKTPTVALFDPDMELRYFGYEAEVEFTNLKEQERKTWYLFQRFKMHLYRNQEKNLKDTKLKPYNREGEIPAIVVFTKVIAHLREEIVDLLNSRDSQTQFDETMIRWVLTVPAIWDDQAKIFMRTAAQQAGINERMLTLALEPEAAALYCRYLRPNLKTDDFGKSVLEPMDRETKYMVADLGGGTVDITVYRIHVDGALQELHSATGGYYGGTLVDESFRSLIKRVFGGSVVIHALDKDPLSMLELQQRFEMAKRSFDPQKRRDVKITIPAILRTLLEKEVEQSFDDYISNCLSENDGVSFIADKIEIESEKFKELFAESVDAIVQHLDDLLNNCQIGKIDALILVGGYAEATMMQDAMETQFPLLRKITPNETSLVVLKGAVLFGHEPLAIRSRLCKYTYGVGVTVPFKEHVHDPRKRRVINNEVLCDDVFDIHIKIGDRVGINIEQKEKRCTPVVLPDLNTMEALVDVYASTAIEPKYVTDDGCTHIGSVCVKLPSGIGPHDPIFIKLIYAGTELVVVAREGNTGRITPGRFDFMG